MFSFPLGSLGVAFVRRRLPTGSRGVRMRLPSMRDHRQRRRLSCDGVSKNSREAVKRDLQILMEAQALARIPLPSHHATSGGYAGVNWTLDIVVELAEELKLHLRIALLYSEQDKRVLKRRTRRARFRRYL